MYSYTYSALSAAHLDHSPVGLQQRYALGGACSFVLRALSRAWGSRTLLPDGAPREAVHLHRLLLSTDLDLINHI
jgi:hypothetical protein